MCIYISLATLRALSALHVPLKIENSLKHLPLCVKYLYVCLLFVAQLFPFLFRTFEIWAFLFRPRNSRSCWMFLIEKSFKLFRNLDKYLHDCDLFMLTVYDALGVHHFVIDDFFRIHNIGSVLKCQKTKSQRATSDHGCQYPLVRVVYFCFHSTIFNKRFLITAQNI